jgi:threonine dehydrogenase-like Zn-dependent dehydrogenase
VPPEITDDQAIMLSVADGVVRWPACRDHARRHGGGVRLRAGGQFAVLSAYLQGAGRVIAVDGLEDRLAIARGQHAEVVDFNAEDPVQTILDLTDGVGVDRVIDAVGVDAERPAEGPATGQTDARAEQLSNERDQVAPQIDPEWAPGDAPSLVADWAAVRGCWPG